jgi:hypothetical protein
LLRKSQTGRGDQSGGMSGDEEEDLNDEMEVIQHLIEESEKFD